ncbi:MAG: putative lipoprotein NlpC [Parasphingorhabdus sp.]|jgi:probable lipoprotein NlpC
MNFNFRLAAIFSMILALFLSGCASTGFTPGGQATQSRQTVTPNLMSHYQIWSGTPYRWGGANRSGVDCSAFVQLTYRNVYRRHVPRHTSDQAKIGKRVSKGRLKSGDLVFFKTGWSNYHVGVYVGRGEFIHASESKGVTRSSLYSSYWDKHYWKARRVI